MAAPQPLHLLQRPCGVCGSPNIRKVDRIATGTRSADLTYLALGQGWMGDAKGPFRAEICRACGHAEFFLENPADLDHIEE